MLFLILQATEFCRVYTPPLGREVEVEEMMLLSTLFVLLLQFYSCDRPFCIIYLDKAILFK